jgi:hypothetical protein
LCAERACVPLDRREERRRRRRPCLTPRKSSRTRSRTASERLSASKRSTSRPRRSARVHTCGPSSRPWSANSASCISQNDPDAPPPRPATARPSESRAPPLPRHRPGRQPPEVPRSQGSRCERGTPSAPAIRQIRGPTTSELGGTVRSGAGNRTMSRWVWQTVATGVRQVKQPPMCGGGPGRSRATTPLGDRDARCQACGGCALASCNCFSASEAAFASHPGAFPPASRVARRIASWAVDPSDQSTFPSRRATQYQFQPLPRRSPRISCRTTSTGPRGVSIIAGSERLRTAVPCGICLGS